MKRLLILLLVTGCERSTLENPVQQPAPAPILAPARTLITPPGYYDIGVIEDTVRGVTCYLPRGTSDISCVKTNDITTKVER